MGIKFYNQTNIYLNIYIDIRCLYEKFKTLPKFYRVSLNYNVISNIINNCITSIFDILWESELRSSNFNIKTYNFFSKWHDSLMRTSFYDFLLKTKLLQDEKNFSINYKNNILKRYQSIKKIETLRYFDLWEKYDLLDYIDPKILPRGYKPKNIKIYG